MAMHEMSLRPAPFLQIKQGRKTIEVRLYDKKRQAIAPGDTIVFTNTESGERITTLVLGLLRYGSFLDLFTRQSLRACGFDDIAAAGASRMMRAYYSEEDERPHV